MPVALCRLRTSPACSSGRTSLDSMKPTIRRLANRTAPIQWLRRDVLPYVTSVLSVIPRSPACLGGSLAEPARRRQRVRRWRRFRRGARPRRPQPLVSRRAPLQVADRIAYGAEHQVEVGFGKAVARVAEAGGRDDDALRAAASSIKAEDGVEAGFQHRAAHAAVGVHHEQRIRIPGAARTGAGRPAAPDRRRPFAGAFERFEDQGSGHDDLFRRSTAAAVKADAGEPIAPPQRRAQDGKKHREENMKHLKARPRS